MVKTTRRTMLMGAAGMIGSIWALRGAAAQSADPGDMYGAVTGEPFPVPAINLARINSRFLRTEVSYSAAEPAGTIVIDPAGHHLYLTDGNGRAIRYGVGVGRQGFAWSGNAVIHDKRSWPDWYPPKEMLARDPSIMESMSHLQGGIGMPGGPGNPLGARAMYLFQGNKDTLFRIHGTVEPWTIGTSISSGCIRMINQDVMDLYERVPVGTKVVVLGNAGRQPEARRAPAPEDADQGPPSDDQYGAQPAQNGYQPDPNAYQPDPNADPANPGYYRGQPLPPEPN